MGDERKTSKTEGGSEDDRAFFAEAVAEIEAWLSDEEKFEIRQEYRAREENYALIDSRERFFGLLNYLEVRYVNLPARLKEIVRVSTLLTSQGNNDVKGEVRFEIPDLSGKSLPLSDISEKVIDLIYIDTIFRDFLTSLGVSHSYREFVKHRGSSLVF